MDLGKIIERLPYYIKAGICVEIRGPSGIGKTDMTRQLVWDLNKQIRKLDMGGWGVGSWGIGSHFFATYTPPDVTGYLMPRTVKVTMADGSVQEQTVSEFSAPAWMRADPGQAFQWLNEFDYGIMVLEEYDKANPEVKKAGAPVTLYGGVGGWFLKPTIGRVLLTNHADDGRQGSTKDFDFCINRKILRFATQSVQGWMKWADENNIHPLFKSFAEDKPAIIFGNTLPEKQGPFPTARSFTMLENAARQGLMDDDGNISDIETFAEEATGAIGSPAANAFMTFLKFRDDVPAWADIVKSPGKAKVSDNAGAQLMAAHICAHNADTATIDAAITYVKRLRPDFHIVFVKSSTRRNFRLANAKPFVAWMEQAPALVALINALGGAR